MVGYTVNTGSSEEFADGWDRVFGGGKITKKKPAKAKAKTAGKAKAKSAKKKPAAKKAGK